MRNKQYTILMIDDSDTDRESYRRYLSKETEFNYQFIEAEFGEEGLEQLASIKVDLILLDYLLPDLDGLEFIEELKLQQNTIPPIIMLTGQGNEAIAVAAMKSGVRDYLVKGQLTPQVLVTSVRNVLQQNYLQSLLNKNKKQQRLIAETALRIRQSLELSEILATAVKEVRSLLGCDRVVIYRFAADTSGDIVAESVTPGWKKSLGLNIIDTCFQDKIPNRYKRGETLAIDNVEAAGLNQCHLELLKQFQVKANAIVPILLAPAPPKFGNSSLWGLLIAHQCSQIRYWETDEVELLNKLAVQLAIAIQQAELLNAIQSELNRSKKLEIELARRVKVLEASEDYIGLASVEGKVIWNNPRMKEIIGITGITNDGEITQLSITDYHPDWAANIIKNQGIPTAISQGSWLGETALKTKNGQEIPVSQLIIAHTSAKGNVEYLSTVMRDLTKQIEAENALKERAKELSWLNQELLKTASLLKKRNEELDRFAYVTSHDLKAPLRAIANLATWLGEDLEGQIPEENQQQLRLMQSRVKRMDGLIQGLLEYSRIGRKNVSIKSVYVQDLINEAIDSLAPPPEFEIVIASDMPMLKTQAVLLQQVFANLISNAIKYHHLGKGKIVILAEDKGEFYEFAVCDDGPGIDPKYHARIFTIFQTLQPRDTIESTGIGLSIVKKIVESQGGKIWVKSQLGEGATFYFTWTK